MQKSPLSAAIASLFLAGATTPLSHAQALEEITVTGKKIQQSLQDTMDSVAVFTAETLESRGLIDLTDTLNQTAGVVGTGRGFRIRGIDSGPVGTLRSELASVYVDGVALSGWVKIEGPQQMWDVSQVEVFRGPQSTNLGRNSLAGAIVVNTQNPTYDQEARLRLGAGSDGIRELSATANLPLVDDTAALRISVDKRERDGAIENTTLNIDDFAKVERQSVRGKLLWEPRQDLTIVANLSHSDNVLGDETQAFEGSGVDRKERISVADVRGKYALKALIASLDIHYNLNENWTLRSITAGMTGERTRIDDFDNTAEDGGVVLRDADDENISQELRYDYNGDTLRGSTGIYYGNFVAKNNNNSTISLSPSDYGVGFLVDLGAYPDPIRLISGGESKLDTTNYAIFTEWEWSLNPSLRLTVGARYDREEQDVIFQNRGSSEVALPNPADFPSVAPIIAVVNRQLGSLIETGPRFAPDTKFDAFLPHIAISYDVSDALNASFFVKRGYRAGGTEITGLNTVNPYDPEYLTNYELALRAEFMDGRAVLNTNAYYGDWEDQQIDARIFPDNDAFTRIENAGKSEIYGVETELNYALNPHLNLFATAGYSKTEITKFITTTGEDLSGNSFRFAPKWTATAGADWQAANGVFLNTTIRYQGKSFSSVRNTTRIDSFTIVNLRGGWENDQWRVEAYANNLFDEDYATTQFGRIDDNGDSAFGRMGEPRTVGARVTYDF